jgi:hypothetical protein
MSSSKQTQDPNLLGKEKDRPLDIQQGSKQQTGMQQQGSSWETGKERI